MLVLLEFLFYFNIKVCEEPIPHRGVSALMLARFSTSRRTNVRLRVEETAILHHSCRSELAFGKWWRIGKKRMFYTILIALTHLGSKERGMGKKEENKVGESEKTGIPYHSRWSESAFGKRLRIGKKRMFYTILVALKYLDWGQGRMVFPIKFLYIKTLRFLLKNGGFLVIL